MSSSIVGPPAIMVEAGVGGRSMRSIIDEVYGGGGSHSDGVEDV